MSRATAIGSFVAVVPLLIVYACFVAGLYGALHDQISYTAAPEYFTQFKFYQFAIPDTWPDRLGAAWVGWQATWWMGFLIGLVLLLPRPAFPSTKAFAVSYLWSALVVTGVALAIGLAALAWGYMFFSESNIPQFVTQWPMPLSDPLAFWRVGNMHNASYVGGAIGGLAGIGFLFWRRLRR